MEGFCRGVVWKGPLFFEICPALGCWDTTISKLSAYIASLLSRLSFPTCSTNSVSQGSSLGPFLSKHFLGSTATCLGGIFISVWITSKFISLSPTSWVTAPASNFLLASLPEQHCVYPASSSLPLRPSPFWAPLDHAQRGVREDGSEFKELVLYTKRSRK